MYITLLKFLDMIKMWENWVLPNFAPWGDIFFRRLSNLYHWRPVFTFSIFCCHSVNSFTLFVLNKIFYFLFKFYHVYNVVNWDIFINNQALNIILHMNYFFDFTYDFFFILTCTRFDVLYLVSVILMEHKNYIEL